MSEERKAEPLITGDSSRRTRPQFPRPPRRRDKGRRFSGRSLLAFTVSSDRICGSCCTESHGRSRGFRQIAKYSSCSARARWVMCAFSTAASDPLCGMLFFSDRRKGRSSGTIAGRLAHHHRALDRVFQLAHVSRPVVAHQHIHRLGRDGCDRLGHRVRILSSRNSRRAGGCPIYAPCSGGTKIVKTFRR